MHASPVNVQAMVQKRLRKFPNVKPNRPSNSVLPAPQTPMMCGCTTIPASAVSESITM